MDIVSWIAMWLSLSAFGISILALARVSRYSKKIVWRANPKEGRAPRASVSSMEVDESRTSSRVTRARTDPRRRRRA